MQRRGRGSPISTVSLEDAGGCVLLFREGVGSAPGVTHAPAVDTPCAQGSPSPPPALAAGNCKGLLPAVSRFQDTMVLICLTLLVMKCMFVPNLKSFTLVALLQSLESRQYQHHSPSPSLIWAAVPESLACSSLQMGCFLSSWAECWACRSSGRCLCHFGAGRKTASGL